VFAGDESAQQGCVAEEDEEGGAFMLVLLAHALLGTYMCIRNTPSCHATPRLSAPQRHTCMV
jgi:hypothetical protein